MTEEAMLLSYIMQGMDGGGCWRFFSSLSPGELGLGMRVKMAWRESTKQMVTENLQQKVPWLCKLKVRCP